MSLIGTIARSIVFLAAGVVPALSQPAGDAIFRGGSAHPGRFDAGGAGQFDGLAWRVQTGGPVRSSPVAAHGALFVGSADAHLYALDLRDGTVRWRAEANASVVAPPAVAAGRVFFSSMTGALYAVEEATGHQLWTKQFGPDSPLAWGFENGDFMHSAVTPVGDALVVGSGDGSVYRLDATTGKTRWTFKTGGRVRSTPAVVAGTVYAASFDGCVYAIDLATGALRWKFETEGHSLRSADFGYDRRSIQSSPAVANGMVFVGSRDGSIYAIDAATGKQRWRVKHPGTSWSINAPAVGDDELFDGSSDAKFVHALRLADGTEGWKTPTPGTVWGSPALGSGVLYVPCGDGTLLALDRRSGKRLWEFRTGGSLFSSPLPVAGLLYFGSNDGGVYALRIGGAKPFVRAVYWDSSSAARSMRGDGALLRDALRGRGYEVLDSRALGPWLAQRSSDRAPSVLVFASDQLPDVVPGQRGVEASLKSYMAADGKVVWTGDPPLIWPADSAGRRSGYSEISRDRTSKLAGVDFTAANFDRYAARPTETGRRWGLGGSSGWWQSAWSVSAAAGLTVLALDERGLAAAFAKSFGGAAGTGFVYVPRSRWQLDDVQELVTVAEIRPVSSSR